MIYDYTNVCRVTVYTRTTPDQKWMSNVLVPQGGDVRIDTDPGQPGPSFTVSSKEVKVMVETVPSAIQSGQQHEISNLRSPIAIFVGEQQMYVV